MEPKMRHVEVTDKLRDLILELLDTIPEVKSIAVVIDWNVGQTEYPYGMMIGRSGSIRTPEDLHGIMIQTAKLARHQSDILLSTIVAADEAAADIAAKIKALKEEHAALKLTEKDEAS